MAIKIVMIIFILLLLLTSWYMWHRRNGHFLIYDIGGDPRLSNIENLNMWGILGRADGEPFDAKDFMKQHPEWNWQKGYLYDRPSQPWTLFD